MKLFRHVLATLAIHWALAAPGTAGAATADEPVSLNFHNAEIEAVIRAIGKITGTNFLLDPRVKGTLNIVTNSPVPRAHTYDVLLAALRLQGYTIVESGGVARVVPEADAKTHAGPVGDTGKRGSIVTTVFTLRHESAAQLLPVIRPLISPNNSVAAFPRNNTLIVTDYADNIERIGRIIDGIDTPPGDVAVIELKHAAAADLAPTVSAALNGNGNGAINGGGQQSTGLDQLDRIQVVPDTRTNSLLLRAQQPQRVAAARRLIQSLDRPGAGGNIHVVYLKNAEAKRVAETLRAALSGGQLSLLPPDQQPLSSDAAAAGNTPRQNPRPTGDTSGSAGGMIQADPLSNALIITAPEAIYNNLRHAIDLLDRRRAQVYVEALIAEISSERAAEWGIQWAAGAGAGEVGVIGASGFSSGGNNLLQLIGGNRAGVPTLPGNGVNVAIGGGSVSIPGIGTIPSLAVLARFLESDAKANILSTPNLVTLDNEEAKIVIGRNVPFVTGQYTTTGTATNVTNPFQTIERKDVGLTLKVRPQISEGGVVKLEIYQEASAVIDGATTSAGIVTTKRSIESTVLVDDGAIIALGGLVEDSANAGEEKVPVLGDLPIAGSLFRYDSRKRTKTNLVVFLRPIILRDKDSYADLTRSRYGYVIGTQDEVSRRMTPMRDEAPAPALPDWSAPPGGMQAPAPVEERPVQ